MEMEVLKSPKVTLASRIDPTLKETLFQEAEEKGLTPSAYVESLLAARNPEVADGVGEELTPLIAEITELQNQLDELVKERDGFANRLEGLMAQGLNFEEDQQEESTLYLDYLSAYYPDVTKEDLVLAGLFAACRNEASFSQYTIQSFLKRSRERRLAAVK